MPQTYCNDNNIYSVDMMFAYINIYKPKSKYIEIATLQKHQNMIVGEFLKKILNIVQWMYQLIQIKKCIKEKLNE